MGTSHSARKRIWLRLLIAGTIGLVAGNGYAQAQTQPKYAQVPEQQMSDPAYSQYAAALIQIDLLASPNTAEFPISVDVPEPGFIELTGMVGNERIRRYVVENAKRVSGLPVRDAMRVTRQEARYAIEIEPERLQHLVNETVTTLFPAEAKNVRASAGTDGVVVLSGSVPSFETKLMLSRAVKSEPGCQAVVNLLVVESDTDTGEVLVSEAGSLRLNLAQLPMIPTAPILEMESPKSASGTTSSGRGALAADDAPNVDLLDRQIREDVQMQILREPDLVDADIAVDVRYGIVYLSGDLKSREQVQLAATAAMDSPDVHKVVAKCRPVSIQRNIPTTATSAAEDSPRPRRRLLGFIPLPTRDNDDPAASWRFRERIRRSLKKYSDGKLNDLSVRYTVDGLVIDGSVANGATRNDIFRHVDNIVELRGVEYDVILRIDEF